MCMHWMSIQKSNHVSLHLKIILWPPLIAFSIKFKAGHWCSSTICLLTYWFSVLRLPHAGTLISISWNMPRSNTYLPSCKHCLFPPPGVVFSQRQPDNDTVLREQSKPYFLWKHFSSLSRPFRDASSCFSYNTYFISFIILYHYHMCSRILH